MELYAGHGGSDPTTETYRIDCDHRDHDDVLGAGGDVLIRPGHGEVGRGGASAGSEEDDGGGADRLEARRAGQE